MESNSGELWFFILLSMQICLSAKSSPGQNGRHFADDRFKGIFINENFCILIRISLKFVPKGQLTISQHWFRQCLGAKQATSNYLNQCWPSSLTHIWGTRGRWVNNQRLFPWHHYHHIIVSSHSQMMSMPRPWRDNTRNEVTLNAMTTRNVLQTKWPKYWHNCS